MWTVNTRIFFGSVFIFIIGFLIWPDQNQKHYAKEVMEENSLDKKSQAESPQKQKQANYPIPRTLRYRFLVKNRTGKTLESAQIRTFSPLNLTATQRLDKLNSTEAFKPVRDNFGNNIMEFIITKFPPYASMVIDIEAQLMMAKEPQPLGLISQDYYLRNEAFFNLDNEEIVKVAGSLHNEDDEESSRAIYDWVKKNLSYAGYIASDHGAGYAIRTRQGDCTEYAYLLAALARINNIPARVIAGYVYDNNAVLRPQDYHNWVEFHVNNRWNIVDPLNDVFFSQKASHVALRIMGGDNYLNYLASQKGIDSDPRLEIKMQ